MKIYEYQAKVIFKREGIKIPAGVIVSDIDKVKEAVDKLGSEVAVKSQVHVGGRGKAGGIKFASTPEEVEKEAGQLLGSLLKGEKVNRVLIEKKQAIKHEYYLGFTLNRKAKRTTMIFSPSGGMDIEEVAKKSPEKVIKIDIDPILGLQNFHFNLIKRAVDYDAEVFSQLKEIVKKLYYIYEKYDCLTVEINPLALLEDGSVAALDGKLEMDDNARYRQSQLMKMWDKDKEDEIELIGRKAGFVVIKLNGRVSVISNGAGLAISTLDLLNRYGTDVANILDLSGGATAEKVERAVNVVTQDEDVEAILFNIFGGITRCDEIASGVSNALKKIPADLPIVCRLQGTNREEGIKILKEAGLEAAVDLEEVVQKVSNII